MIANTTGYQGTGEVTRITVCDSITVEVLEDMMAEDNDPDYPGPCKIHNKLKTNTNLIPKRFNRPGKRGRQDNR